MNPIKARFFKCADVQAWDAFCSKCNNSTFLHTRRFLSYHKEKFLDRSIILERNDEIVGVLAAAESLTNDRCVISHPGITYGGILHAGFLKGANMGYAFESIMQLFRVNDYKIFEYKVTPFIYHKAPLQDDLYYLYRMGGVRSRCDLSSCIMLQNRLPISNRRLRSIKKASKFCLKLSSDPIYIPDMWNVLSENLLLKHGVSPTHSLEEILHLHNLFPENIKFLTAHYGGSVIAGLVLFKCSSTIHAQYIASSRAGYDLSALDLLFSKAIEDAGGDGALYFDFGISTENQGKILNEGLYQFKSEFGAGSIVHEFYKLEV